MQRDPNDTLIRQLIRKVDDLLRGIDKVAIAEYVELFRNPRRMLWMNFFAGVARGFGIAVGVTVVGSLFILLLARLASLNLPIIGEFLADLTRTVQMKLSVP